MSKTADLINEAAALAGIDPAAPYLCILTAADLGRIAGALTLTARTLAKAGRIADAHDVTRLLNRLSDRDTVGTPDDISRAWTAMLNTSAAAPVPTAADTALFDRLGAALRASPPRTPAPAPTPVSHARADWDAAIERYRGRTVLIPMPALDAAVVHTLLTDLLDDWPADFDMPRDLAVRARAHFDPTACGSDTDIATALAGLQALYADHVCPECRPKILRLARRLLPLCPGAAAPDATTDPDPEPARPSRVDRGPAGAVDL